MRKKINNLIELMWSVSALQTIWCIFDNDAHKIVSKQGQKELLIQIMKHDEENGMYDADFNEKKSKENLD